jgi:hypothetical protein
MSLRFWIFQFSKHQFTLMNIFDSHRAAKIADLLTGTNHMFRSIPDFGPPLFYR